MRACWVAAVPLLAACSGETAENPPPDPDALIACALAGASDFNRDCAVERIAGEAGLELVVRHPDGAFRRFDVLTDGSGLATADGAERARVAVRDDGIEVTLGADRYRFPATIAGHVRP